MMSAFKVFLTLMIIFFGSVAYGQPAPECNILFNVQKEGETLNQANAKFSLYKSCDNEKRKLKQSDNFRESMVMGGTKVFRQVSVLRQYLSCERIIVKVRHGKEKMEIHFITNQADLYNIYYLHEEIEFVAGKLLVINLGNNVEDAVMKTQSIGSSQYKWVLPPVYDGNNLLFNRPAILSVDSIIYGGSRELAHVQFKMEIGIDSLNRRFPQFCYNKCAQRLLYGETFDVFRRSDSGEWVDATEEAGLLIPVIALCETCDLSKVIDDENANGYFQKLKYDFSLNFKKFGSYKLVCKMDTTVRTDFTISGPGKYGSVAPANQLEIDRHQLIGDWELISFTYDTTINKKPPPEFFKNHRLSFGKKRELRVTRSSFGRRFQGKYFLQKKSLVLFINTANVLSGVTPRPGPDVEYAIEKLNEKLLILTQEGGEKYGTFVATYMKY